MQPIKIIIEKHLDGYVAYPIGVKGIVVGEGDTYEEALADVKSAIQFHIETFGRKNSKGAQSPGSLGLWSNPRRQPYFHE